MALNFIFIQLKNTWIKRRNHKKISKIMCLFFLIFPFFTFATIQKESPLEFISVEEKSDLLLKDEVEALESLIQVNETRLQTQKELKDAMRLFQKQKWEFVSGNESKNHAFSMVSNARRILGQIKEEHLAYLFSPEYLEELVFFSSIAAKSTPIRP